LETRSGRNTQDRIHINSNKQTRTSFPHMNALFTFGSKQTKFGKIQGARKRRSSKDFIYKQIALEHIDSFACALDNIWLFSFILDFHKSVCIASTQVITGVLIHERDSPPRSYRFCPVFFKKQQQEHTHGNIFFWFWESRARSRVARRTFWERAEHIELS
jgi:hypothetical protein